MNLKKAWYRSKTIIANVVAIIPPVVVLITPFLGMPEVQALIPADWFKYYAVMMALLNLFLRTITSEPIGRGN